MIGKRVGDKSLGGQIRPSDVTARQSRPADMQFSGFAEWHRLHELIENIDSIVGDRPSDRNRGIRMQVTPGGDDCGFGGAVGVDHPAIRPRPSVDEMLRAGFSTDDEQPHAGNIVRHHGQQCGHAGKYGHFCLRKYFRKPVAGMNHLGGAHHDRGTGK